MCIITSLTVYTSESVKTSHSLNAYNDILNRKVGDIPNMDGNVGAMLVKRRVKHS